MCKVVKIVLVAAALAASLAANAVDLPLKSVQLPIGAFASKVAEARKLPGQFAIVEPVRYSAAGAEGWSSDGRLATWRMRLTVPQAVSLSFHADEVYLPKGSVLRVSSGQGTDREYTQADVTDGLWALHHTGQSLLLTLIVDAKDRAQTRLSINNLYVGFSDMSNMAIDGWGREPESGVLREPTSTNPAPGTDACARVNQQCYDTGPSRIPARSTVVIVIESQRLCTGTLINNTSNDKKPLIMSAGHCRIAASTPTKNSASGVVAYFQDTSPCGTPLANSINSTFNIRGLRELAFSPYPATSAETATRKDYWLLEMNAAPPAGANAVWAGFNANAVLPTSFLATHHGSGFDRQLASGKSIASTANGNELSTKFFGRGISQGASGGGLFDQNGRTIGWLSASSGTTDAACYGSEAEGDAANRTAFYIPYSGSFNYTKTTFPVADAANDSTPMKPHLDPGNTGRLTTDTLTTPVAPVVTLTPSATSIALGQPVTLNWSSTDTPNTCTASALPQSAAAGWTGARSSASSESITPSSATTITFKLDCSNSAGTGSQSVQVIVRPLPAVTFASNRSSANTNDSVTLSWSSSNTTVCTASGAWSGSKTTSGTETVNVGSTEGTNSYTLTCTGPDGSDAKTVAVSVTNPPPAPAPTLTLSSNRSSAQTGEFVTLSWNSGNATSCTASGDWSGAKAVSGSENVSVGTTAGSRSYTLTCNGAGGSISRSATVSINAASTNNANGGTTPAAGVVTTQATGAGGALDGLLLLPMLVAARLRSRSKRPVAEICLYEFR